MTNQLAPWGRVLDNLIITQLVKKFSTFCGTRSFITIFTRACHWSLSWAGGNHSTHSRTIYLRSILISSHLRLTILRIYVFFSMPFLHVYALSQPLQQSLYPFKKSMWLLVQASLHKKFNFIPGSKCFSPRASLIRSNRWKSLVPRSQDYRRGVAVLQCISSDVPVVTVAVYGHTFEWSTSSFWTKSWLYSVFKKLPVISCVDSSLFYWKIDE
jgi:hypothetical protein